MNITCITGTDVKGCTYHLKEIFLAQFPNANITEFKLPSQAPAYCLGCKKCFLNGEEFCPHAEKVQPIWQSLLSCDLILFVYPVYVMRAPGHVKALLDHFGFAWFAHRPRPEMFDKTAAIITQSIGAPNGNAQKDVKTSLNWLGVSKVKTLGMGMIEGIEWDKLSHNRKDKITNNVKKFAQKFQNIKAENMSFRVNFFFKISQMMQKSVKKKGVDSLDLKYWEKQGWV